MTGLGEPRAAGTWRRYAPWVVGIVMLIGLVVVVDLAEVIDALRRADLARYAPLAVGFILVWFLVETHNLGSLLKRFGHRRPLSELAAVRAYTYLLMVLNYNLGVGGIALYLRSTVGIPMVEASSLMLFYMYAEVASLAAMSVLGAVILPGEPHVGKIALIAGGFLIGSTALIAGYRSFGDHLPRRLGRLSLLASFREASPSTVLIIIVGRGAYFLAFIAFFYLALPAFSVEVPFMALLVLVPTIFFIGNLPVSAAGLGTMQAAMLFFFRSYGSQSDIAAFSIVYSGTLIVLRLPLGLVAAWRHAGLVFGPRNAFAQPPIDLGSSFHEEDLRRGEPHRDDLCLGTSAGGSLASAPILTSQPTTSRGNP